MISLSLAASKAPPGQSGTGRDADCEDVCIRPAQAHPTTFRLRLLCAHSGLSDPPGASRKRTFVQAARLMSAMGGKWTFEFRVHLTGTQAKQVQTSQPNQSIRTYR